MRKKLGLVDFRKDVWDCYKGTGGKWPIVDQRVPGRDPRNNCGTHFGSSSLLDSKMANSSSFNGSFTFLSDEFSFFSPLAIPMFVCWGVSTALGVVIQYKITANNLNSGSSLLQFCNCCDRPKPDRWQDTSFFTSDDVKWRHEQVTCSTLFLWQNLADRNTRSPYVECSPQAPHPHAYHSSTRCWQETRHVLFTCNAHYSSSRHEGDHVHQDTCLHQDKSS